MRNRCFIKLIFVAIVFSLGLKPVLAQHTITGRVIDHTKQSLPGVAVILKGTSVGATTDLEGKFSINVPNNSATLQFSFLGYVTQEIIVGNRGVIDVQLSEDLNELDAAVVVGYQTVQKKFVSGSVASIKTEELADLPSVSLASLIAGKATGVLAMNLGGAPGSAGAITIRGNTVVSGNLGEANQFSSPLYVIDGVPTTLEELAGYGKTNNDFLASLNTDDIASIDILKDASAAAIYGSRGANGVIIIKSRSGQPGKMKVSFKAQGGVSMKPNLVRTPVGAAERRMKMQLINDTWGYDSKRSQVPIMLSDSLNPAFNNNMDYQGLFYQTGIVQDYNASITGGTEQLNYRLSGGYYSEEGIIKNTGLDRYTFNINVSQKPWERVRNQTIVNTSLVNRQPGMSNANSRGSLPVSPTAMNSSLFALTDEQYKYLTGQLNDYYIEDKDFNTTISNILNIDIWKGIAFNSQINGSFYSSKRNEFKPSIIRTDGKGEVNYDYNQQYRLISENYLSYSNNIINKNHNINLLLGQSYEYNNIQTNSIYAIGGSGDMIKTISGYRKEDIDGYTSISENGMLSYWARLGYRFKERYQLDLNFRRDASSRFGKNNRWATFPSVSAFWIFTEEPILKEFVKDWLTFGKLRYSLGRTGKQFTDDYLRYNMYVLSYNSFDYSGNSMNPTTYNGIMAVIPDFGKLADDKLSWEISDQRNFGLDLEFFKNRIYVAFDYYTKDTDKLLAQVQFPDYTGFGQVKSNLVGVRNSGYEISVDAHLFPRDNKFTLEIITGFSHNDNLILKLPNGNRDYMMSDYGYVVGMPTTLFRGLIYDGPLKNINDLPVNPFTGKPLDPTKDGIWGKVAPGYPLFRDVNGDYLVSDNADQDVVLSSFNPNPKITGYLNINAKYKNWQLRVNTFFVLGRDIYDEVSQSILNRYDWSNEWVTKSMINIPDYDFWTINNPNAKYPSLVPQADGIPQRYAFRGNSTMWWEKGDFFKINELTLSYNFEDKWVKGLGLDRLYLHFTAFNVWQWQASKTVIDASMVDPRGHTFGDGYPMPRKYVFGVNVQF